MQEDAIPALVKRCETLARLCAFSIAALGVAVLIGWLLDIATLKGVLPGLATMKANTALCFFFAGASLSISTRDQRLQGWQTAQQIAAAVVMLIGLLTVGEYVSSANFGIDQLLFTAPLDPMSKTAPGRMASATAIGFVFTGLALFLPDSRRWRSASQFAAIIGILIGVLATTGYAYGISALYGVFAYSSLALHTAVGFVVINLGVIISRPRQGLMTVVMSNTSGGHMARLLLPIAISAPFLIGWMNIQGEKNGLYGPEFGLAMVAVSYVVLFSFLVWRTTEVIRSKDRLRIAGEHARNKQYAQLTGIINSAMDAIITLDEELCIRVFNPAAEQIFGYTSDEITGASMDRLIPARFSQVHGLYLRRFAEEGVTNRSMKSQSKLFALRSDNTEFPIEASISKVKIHGEQIFTVILRDISERHKAEESLLASEERFRALVEQAADGVFVANEQGNYIEVNSAGCAMLGYSREELMGLSIANVIDPAEIPRIGTEITRFGGGAITVSEWNFRRKDDSLFIGEVRGRQLADGRLQAVLIDITERKRIEVELQIAATAFEAQVGIIVTDIHANILRVNHAFTLITGYSAEEVVGKTPRLLKSGRHNTDFYNDMWKSIRNEGLWEGEIWDRRKNGEIYPKWMTITAVTSKDGETIHYVGTQVDITNRKAAEEEIRNLAFYDPLTKLPNRRMLLDRLQHALASSSHSGKEGALLFIDLDNFKNLNDTLGHDMGDLLLQQVAQRLKSCVRESDTVARLGGDEFVVMLEDLSKHTLEAAEETEIVGEKIIASLNSPYQLNHHKYISTPSIGATLFVDHKQGIEELFKQADIAMYQAKKAGRNTLRFYDPQMQESINTRAALEDDLRRALAMKQLRLYYQIQVDDSNHPIGAEALIRWMHPERGLIMPVDFIPLAEETKLIVRIGQWVMEAACAQLKEWEQTAFTRNLVLSVNVSPQQFFHADFVAQVKSVIQRHAINAKLLKLEVTESMMLEDIEGIIANMNTLKEVGVRFSLDDFGTGYSSLQYLKRLPLDQLKIDRSFVRDLVANSSDKEIVCTIIAMAHNLNLDVIAEGVEAEEQQQFLLNAGCSYYQGFLFSKPVPIEQFELLLK